MRIVSWNCNGGFSRKWPVIEALNPDIVIIQEATENDIGAIDATSRFWTGHRLKGLGVITFGDQIAHLDDSFDPELPWFLPVRIGAIRLLAVWASVKSNRLQYVRLLHAALDHYVDFLAHPRGAIIGDFNSSAAFDAKHKGLSHSDLVARLDEVQYTSLWHSQMGELHGEELRPTFYMYRREQPTWHLDYAFLTPAIVQNATLELGTPDLWLAYSDHMPLIVDLPDG